METSPMNETTVTVVVIGIAVVLALLLAFSQWVLYRVSIRLSELVPPEFASSITELLTRAADAGKITLATKALELADTTQTTIDNELLNATLSTLYSISRTDDGRYVLMPKGPAQDEHTEG